MPDSAAVTLYTGEEMLCDGETELLISLVQQRRQLYDTSLLEHANRTVTDKLWREVAEAMKKSVAECKLRWSGLRSSYARALRLSKVEYGSSASRKRGWYLSDAMSFLAEFIQHRRSGDGKGAKRGFVPEEYSDEEVDVSARNTVPEVPPEKTRDRFLSKRKISSKQAEPIPTSNKVARKTSDFKTRAKSPVPVSNPEENFLKSLLPDIMSLSNKRRRMFKELVIQNLNRLMDAEEDEAVSGTSKCTNCQISIKSEEACPHSISTSNRYP